MTTVITFIIVFCIIVIVHEFGHYFFAKRSGILVREFSIGMGPKLFYKHVNETTYTLRLLPLGGYVRMAGMQDEEDELKPGTIVLLDIDDDGLVKTIDTSEKPSLRQGIPFQVSKADLVKELFIEGYENGDESELKRYKVDHDAIIVEADGTGVQIAPLDVQFQSASLKNRMLTNFAGPMNNFILGIIVFIILAFMQGGVPVDKSGIGQIQEDSVAQKAGLKTDDVILAVDGKKTSTFTQLSGILQKSANKELTLKVKRGDQNLSIDITPKAVKSDGKTIGQIGVGQPYDRSLGAKLVYGVKQPWQIAVTIFKVLGSFFTGGFSLNKLSGPVGIFVATSEYAKHGIMYIMYFLGMLSINLGIMNLLPIPALDGGKLVLNIYEGLRGKPLAPEKEGIITLVGVGALVLLMILVTANDFWTYFIK